jgi:hypothetical protein
MLILIHQSMIQHNKNVQNYEIDKIDQLDDQDQNVV